MTRTFALIPAVLLIACASVAGAIAMPQPPDGGPDGRGGPGGPGFHHGLPPRLLDDIQEREKKVAFDFLRKVNARLLVLEQQDLYPFHVPARPDISAARPVPDPAPASPRKKRPAKP